MRRNGIHRAFPGSTKLLETAISTELRLIGAMDTIFNGSSRVFSHKEHNGIEFIDLILILTFLLKLFAIHIETIKQ